MRTIFTGCFNHYQALGQKLSYFDGVPALLLRIYLAPIFILAGLNKLNNIESTAYWFDASLGLPLPTLMAYLAGGTEFFGGILLVAGLATRLISLPLMFTMIIAATTAHWDNGWHALPESQLTVPWEWRTDLIEEAQLRKAKAVALLKEHGHYPWLSSAGSITILKNGIEFAATYFVMLLALLVQGGGRFVSVDYYLARWMLSGNKKSGK